MQAVYRGMGRPTKLTPKLLEQLDEIADDAMTIKDACADIGIDQAQWYRWLASDSDSDLIARFRQLALRVRESSGRKTDDLAWGVLREVAEDPEAKHSDRVAAASNMLRLRTPHRVEHSGPDGAPLTLSMLAGLASSDDE